MANTIDTEQREERTFAAELRRLLGITTQEHPVGVGVQCPVCGAETIPTWPFEHCHRCGNRNWGGDFRDDTLEGLRERLAELEAREQERRSIVDEAAKEAEPTAEEMRYRQLWARQQTADDFTADEAAELAGLEAQRQYARDVPGGTVPPSSGDWREGGS